LREPIYFDGFLLMQTAREPPILAARRTYRFSGGFELALHVNVLS